MTPECRCGTKGVRVTPRSALSCTPFRRGDEMWRKEVFVPHLVRGIA